MAIRKKITKTASIASKVTQMRKALYTWVDNLPDRIFAKPTPKQRRENPVADVAREYSEIKALAKAAVIAEKAFREYYLDICESASLVIVAATPQIPGLVLSIESGKTGRAAWKIEAIAQAAVVAKLRGKGFQESVYIKKVNDAVDKKTAPKISLTETYYAGLD